jgi:hypothetical protein
MRNEAPFSDVPTSHKYSRYIWAVNRLGIMMGNGDGTFRPDSELSMQEFAVTAQRIIQWAKQEAVKLAETGSWKEDPYVINNYSPEDIARVDAEYKERAEKGFEPPANSEPRVFVDNDKIADWATPAIDLLSRWEILQGDAGRPNPSRLHPTEMLSKTRFLVFLYKFADRLILHDDGIPELKPLF